MALKGTPESGCVHWKLVLVAGELESCDGGDKHDKNGYSQALQFGAYLLTSTDRTLAYTFYTNLHEVYIYILDFTN
jgi:hypothetical protein